MTEEDWEETPKSVTVTWGFRLYLVWITNETAFEFKVIRVWNGIVFDLAPTFADLILNDIQSTRAYAYWDYGHFLKLSENKLELSQSLNQLYDIL